MKKIILIALLLIGIIFSSCEDFNGWNVDGKNPSFVPASYLVTNAEKNLFTRMASTSVNNNIFKLFAQQWTEVQYTDEANYDILGRDIGGNFAISLYRDVLNDLNDASRLIDEDQILDPSLKSTQKAVVELLSIYTWHVLVDTYGYIAYTEALQGANNLTPVYDSGESVYTDLFARLDIALGQLNAGSDSFGGADLIYNGSTAQWKKFGNSLKLKMAVRTDDFDHARSVTLASQAVAGGVLTSSSDNAAFPFESAPPNTNPIWVSLVQSGRNDYVPANTFVDLIVPLNDPRTPVYFDNNVSPYVGGVYGAGTNFASATHIGTAWHQPDFEAIILSYDEVEFLLAEAIERNLISGNAETNYNAGITASIMYWGGSMADATTYLAQPSVAYTTAGTTWKEVIGNQKYIALYGRGFEAWSSWRVLDFPNTMSRPPISMEPVPRRYVYGKNDADLNQANYDAASSAMSGDLKSSRVFWDITGQGN